MANTVVRLEITGQVQGVGSRWTMAEQARRLGIRGWVRNRRDGSVEVMVAGDSASVDQLIVWAHKGPPTAAIEAVKVIADGTETEFESFEQRPTVGRRENGSPAESSSAHSHAHRLWGCWRRPKTEPVGRRQQFRVSATSPARMPLVAGAPTSRSEPSAPTAFLATSDAPDNAKLRLVIMGSPTGKAARGATAFGGYDCVAGVSRVSVPPHGTHREQT